MKVVSITSQGQISIPAKFRRELGLKKSGKAIVSVDKNKLVIEPVKDFFELGGTLKTNKKYNIREAREQFEQYMADQAMGLDI